VAAAAVLLAVTGCTASASASPSPSLATPGHVLHVEHPLGPPSVSAAVCLASVGPTQSVPVHVTGPRGELVGAGSLFVGAQPQPGGRWRCVAVGDVVVSAVSDYVVQLGAGPAAVELAPLSAAAAASSGWHIS